MASNNNMLEIKKQFEHMIEKHIPNFSDKNELVAMLLDNIGVALGNSKTPDQKRDDWAAIETEEMEAYKLFSSAIETFRNSLEHYLTQGYIWGEIEHQLKQKNMEWSDFYNAFLVIEEVATTNPAQDSSQSIGERRGRKTQGSSYFAHIVGVYAKNNLNQYSAALLASELLAIIGVQKTQQSINQQFRDQNTFSVNKTEIINTGKCS